MKSLYVFIRCVNRLFCYLNVASSMVDECIMGLPCVVNFWMCSAKFQSTLFWALILFEMQLHAFVGIRGGPCYDMRIKRTNTFKSGPRVPWNTNRWQFLKIHLFYQWIGVNCPLWLWYSFDILRPNDECKRHWTGSSLFRFTIWLVPTRYLNLCWVTNSLNLEAYFGEMS